MKHIAGRADLENIIMSAASSALTSVTRRVSRGVSLVITTP